MLALWTDNKDILVMLSDMDINAIAGTLKLYFRELPEPLLTDRLYPAFMEGIGKDSGMGKASMHKRGSCPSQLGPLGPGCSCRLQASSGLVVLLPSAHTLAARRYLAMVGPAAAPDPALSPLPPCFQPSRILLPRRTA